MVKLVRCIGMIIMGYVILSMVNSELSEFNPDKILAEEYGVPMELISTSIKTESCYLLLPHYEYFITTSMGKDVTLFTSYFGIVFFNDDNIEKYLGLNSLKKELKSRGFYEWAE